MHKHKHTPELEGVGVQGLWADVTALDLPQLEGQLLAAIAVVVAILRLVVVVPVCAIFSKLVVDGWGMERVKQGKSEYVGSECGLLHELSNWLGCQVAFQVGIGDRGRRSGFVSELCVSVGLVLGCLSAHGSHSHSLVLVLPLVLVILAVLVLVLVVLQSTTTKHNNVDHTRFEDV